jgi:hypothetical protein
LPAASASSQSAATTIPASSQTAATTAADGIKDGDTSAAAASITAASDDPGVRSLIAQAKAVLAAIQKKLEAEKQQAKPANASYLESLISDVGKDIEMADSV